MSLKAHVNGFINHHLLGWKNLPPNQFGGKPFPSNIIFIIKSICSQKTGILPSNILYFPSTNTERNPSCLNNVQERDGFSNISYNFLWISILVECVVEDWESEGAGWWATESLTFLFILLSKNNSFFLFLFFVVYRLSIVYTHIKAKNMSI